MNSNRIEEIEALRGVVSGMLWPSWQNYVYFGGGGGSLSPHAAKHTHRATQEFEAAVDAKVLFYLKAGISAEDLKSHKPELQNEQ